MLHVNLIFFLIDEAFYFGREGIIILVGNSIDELDAGRADDDNFPHVLKIVLFALQTHILFNDYLMCNIDD